MFTGFVPPPLPASVSEAGKADGFIHLCRQSALEFGANRRMPVAFRPVVRLKADGDRLVILPCTSRKQVDQNDFFVLCADRVSWKNPSPGTSYAYWRYEVVPATLAPNMIGCLLQSARIDLLTWLKGRY